MRNGAGSTRSPGAIRSTFDRSTAGPAEPEFRRPRAGSGAYADRSTTTRSRTLREPTAHTPAIRDTLYATFAALGLQRARVRAVTARTGNLATATGTAVQLTSTESHRTLEPVLDRAVRRFGPGATAPAALGAYTRRG
ncbi:hypothetical protein [Streptomyces sp. NBC_01538]|uniref:DinB/UmuC family translesion DNA polymerase n=1 Tax=Streptomyces sp. NBC_01538 TaxID=2903897 RepID=UPI003870B83B